MQGKRVLLRETLLQDEAAKIADILPDITTWTSWMKSTTHIISSTQNTLVQGDEFELQRIVKVLSPRKVDCERHKEFGFRTIILRIGNLVGWTN